MSQILSVKKSTKEDKLKREKLNVAEKLWFSISSLVSNILEMSLNDSQIKCIIQYKTPSQDYISIKTEIQRQTLIPITFEAKSKGIYIKKDDTTSLKFRLSKAKKRLMPSLGFISKNPKENNYLEVTFKRGQIIWVNKISGTNREDSEES